MNNDIAQGKWRQLKGRVQQQWGDLTDDDLDRIDGSSERFAGVMQERYGMSKEEADKEFKKLQH